MMNRTLVRALTWLLLLSLLFCLTACGGSGDADETTKRQDGNPDDTTAAQAEVYTREVEPLPDEFDDLDFGGETFRMLTRGVNGDQFTVEELNSDPVNDAIYNRNIAVEDMLNVKIEEEPMAYYDITLEVQKVVMSGDPTYDVVAGSVAYNTPQIDQGMFYNLYANGFDTYLDLSKPWWPQGWIEEARMGDRLYCLTGPLAMTFRRYVYVFYYNKDLGADYGVENMYDVVNEGRWTIDYLNNAVKEIYRDLNGNSERDDEDLYGILINAYDHLDIFWSCFDMDFLGKDEDGWFVLAANEEKISTAFDKVFSLMYDNVGRFGPTDPVGRFANGQALFCCAHLEVAEQQVMRNTTVDFGMLPQPKFDEAQKDYYSYSHDQYSVLMVPVSCKNPEMIGAVLQALDYETYAKVEPIYFDQTLKGKYSNDPETRQMINIILDGMVEDGCWIYGFNLAQPQVKCFRGPIENRQRTFTSEFAKLKRSIPVGLRDWREKIEKFDH